MTSENKELLRKLIGEEANEYMSMDKVCNAIKNRLKSGKVVKDENKVKIGFDYTYEIGRLYAETVDTYWKKFTEFVRMNMPHVIFNGSSDYSVVDWVKTDDKDKAKRAFKVWQTVGYEGKGKDRHVVRTSQTEDSPIFVITREEEVTRTEEVKLASGYPITVPSRDKDGNLLTDKVEVMFMPREKGVWGFSEVLVDAFVQAVEDLEDFLGTEEGKKYAAELEAKRNKKAK